MISEAYGCETLYFAWRIISSAFRSPDDGICWPDLPFAGHKSRSYRAPADSIYDLGSKAAVAVLAATSFAVEAVVRILEVERAAMRKFQVIVPIGNTLVQP